MLGSSHEQALECASSDPCEHTSSPSKRPVANHTLRRRSDQIEKLARLGTFEIDLETAALKWSNGTYRIFGLNPGTPISLEEALRFYDANTRREIEARLEAARAFDRPYDITVPFRQENGETRWARVIAHVSRTSGRARLIGAVQDVTRDHYREESLRIQTERSSVAEVDERLLEDVAGGLARSEFEAFYQPIVDLRTRIVRGWEALIRWHHPRRGLLLPGQFASALIHPMTSAAIDEFMLTTSLDHMRAWIDAGVPVTCAGVNVSEVQLKRPDFAEEVLTQLEIRRLAPDRLKIEVLETAFLGQDTDAVARTIDRLASRGVVSALDDFGTGFASLTHLKRFRVERIKIDRSFVANLGFDAFDHSIVRCLTTLGRDLNIRITAEGIETPEQLRILRSMGCDCGQGYLFSPPMPAAQVPDFLNAWGRDAAPRVFDHSARPAPKGDVPCAEWAAWDAAVLLGCLGNRAKPFVQRLAEAERVGALTDLFPAQHFQRMLRDLDHVMATSPDNEPKSPNAEAQSVAAHRH